MRKLCFLLCVFPALALGQGLTPLAPGQTGGGKTLLSLPFGTPGCYASGTGGVSITRAASSTYESPAGTINTCAAGSYRVEENGLLVEPARSNAVLYSGQITNGGSGVTSPWNLGDCALSTVTGAPDGGSWAQCAGTANIGRVVQSVSVSSSASFAGSAWIRKPSGYSEQYGGLQIGCAPATPSSCACSVSDGSSCTASVNATNYCMGVASQLTATPKRVTVTTTCSSPITGLVFYLLSGNHTIANGTSMFAAAQLEVGTYPTSYIPTNSGTSASRAADAVSVSNPALSSKWSLAGSFKPYGGRAWTTSGTLWSMGTNAGADSAKLVAGTDLVLALLDGSSGSKTCTASAPGFAAGSSQSLTVKDKGGTLSFASPDCTQAGAGTGSFGTVPTTLYLGTLSSTGSEWGGYIKNVVVTKNPK